MVRRSGAPWRRALTPATTLIALELLEPPLPLVAPRYYYTPSVQRDPTAVAAVVVLADDEVSTPEADLRRGRKMAAHSD